MKTIHMIEALIKELDRYMEIYPAFRNRPIGAPYSNARKNQENAMQLEDSAKETLRKANEFVEKLRMQFGRITDASSMFHPHKIIARDKVGRTREWCSEKNFAGACRKRDKLQQIYDEAQNLLPASERTFLRFEVIRI